MVLLVPGTSFGNLGYCAVMAKSKNHTVHNQSQKRHKKLLSQSYESVRAWLAKKHKIEEDGSNNAHSKTIQVLMKPEVKSRMTEGATLKLC